MKKAVIFAPFWRQANHVGNLRIDRFLRWLVEDGYHVVVIRAGSVEQTREESWGTEITVRDPVGLYRDDSPSGDLPLARKPNKLRRALSYWLFNPDIGIVWAHTAAGHPSVLKAAIGSDFILSSNPPESAHVGAWKLSRKLGLPHIVDMRDGWLDEPLKPMLRSSAFRRWQEGRLEARILREASAIQVTSDVWQDMLCKRLPELISKVVVLTNGYPPSVPQVMREEKKRKNTRPVLVHAGRFLGSMRTRSPALLLQPLLDSIKHKPSQGTVKLIGLLSAEELKIIERFEVPFANQGWHIECPGSLPRQELLKLLPQADGLLLLSETFAAIPCKLFEYIPTGRPILVVTDQNSATWQVCVKLPQATLLETRAQPDSLTFQSYLNAVSSTDLKTLCPDEYSEDHLSGIMRLVINKILVRQAASDI